jgi:hypothetical protein
LDPAASPRYEIGGDFSLNLLRILSSRGLEGNRDFNLNVLTFFAFCQVEGWKVRGRQPQSFLQKKFLTRVLKVMMGVSLNISAYYQAGILNVNGARTLTFFAFCQAWGWKLRGSF